MAHRPCRITSPFSPDCALVEAQHEGAGSPLTSAAEAQSRDTPRDYSPGNSSQEGRRKLYPGPRGAIFPGKCLARKYSFEGHISKNISGNLRKGQGLYHAAAGDVHNEVSAGGQDWFHYLAAKCACARAPQDRGWCRSAHRRVSALAPSYTYSSSPPGWSGDLRRCCQNVTTVAPASCRLHPIEYSIVCNHSSQRFIKPSRFQASKAAAAVSRPAQCVRNAALAPRGSHAAPALPGSAPRRAASLEPVAPAWTLALDT